MNELSIVITAFITDSFLLGRTMDLASIPSFLQAGILDSTGVLELVQFLEDKWGITVKDDEMRPENFDSVEGMVRFVAKKTVVYVLVHHLLEAAAQSSPRKIALVCGDRSATYGELDRCADARGHALMRTGIEPGERVALCGPSSIEWVAAFFGACKVGAVAMPVHPSTPPARLARLLDDAEASALIASPEKLAETQRPRHLRAMFSLADDAAQPPAPARSRPARTSDLAALLYTSGSTGRPKGVMHTHGSLVAATRMITSYLGNVTDDVVLSALPLSFGYGLTQLLTSCCVGATLVMEPSFAFPRVVLERIRCVRATGFAFVPTMAALMLENDPGSVDLTSLRYLTNAGAGMPASLVRRLRETLPNAELFAMYGQTECIRASYLPPHEVDRRPESVGCGMIGQDHWLVDEDGRQARTSIAGELVVQGPHVMTGYWRRPQETAAKLRVDDEGRRTLSTGDLFVADAGGWLTFRSRSDDIIKTRGEKVSPREVEEAILGLPDILEVAVIGVPDRLLGASIEAFVVARPGTKLDEREVRRHCATELIDVAVPRHVRFVDALPKNANHKIDKAALRGDEVCT